MLVRWRSKPFVLISGGLSDEYLNSPFSPAATVPDKINRSAINCNYKTLEKLFFEVLDCARHPLQ